jgi:hypothetical protein
MHVKSSAGADPKSKSNGAHQWARVQPDIIAIAIAPAAPPTSGIQDVVDILRTYLCQQTAQFIAAIHKNAAMPATPQAHRTDSTVNAAYLSAYWLLTVRSGAPIVVDRNVLPWRSKPSNTTPTEVLGKLHGARPGPMQRDTCPDRSNAEDVLPESDCLNVTVKVNQMPVLVVLWVVRHSQPETVVEHYRERRQRFGFELDADRGCANETPCVEPCAPP